MVTRRNLVFILGVVATLAMVANGALHRSQTWAETDVSLTVSAAALAELPVCSSCCRLCPNTPTEYLDDAFGATPKPLKLQASKAESKRLQEAAANSRSQGVSPAKGPFGEPEDGTDAKCCNICPGFGTGPAHPMYTAFLETGVETKPVTQNSPFGYRLPPCCNTCTLRSNLPTYDKLLADAGATTLRPPPEELQTSFVEVDQSTGAEAKFEIFIGRRPHKSGSRVARSHIPPKFHRNPRHVPFPTMASNSELCRAPKTVEPEDTCCNSCTIDSGLAFPSAIGQIMSKQMEDVRRASLDDLVAEHIKLEALRSTNGNVGDAISKLKRRVDRIHNVERAEHEALAKRRRLLRHRQAELKHVETSLKAFEAGPRLPQTIVSIKLLRAVRRRILGELAPRNAEYKPIIKKTDRFTRDEYRSVISKLSPQDRSYIRYIFAPARTNLSPRGNSSPAPGALPSRGRRSSRNTRLPSVSKDVARVLDIITKVNAHTPTSPQLEKALKAVDKAQNSDPAGAKQQLKKVTAPKPPKIMKPQKAVKGALDDVKVSMKDLKKVAKKGISELTGKMKEIAMNLPITVPWESKDKDGNNSPEEIAAASEGAEVAEPVPAAMPVLGADAATSKVKAVVNKVRDSLKSAGSELKVKAKEKLAELKDMGKAKLKEKLQEAKEKGKALLGKAKDKGKALLRKLTGKNKSKMRRLKGKNKDKLRKAKSKGKSQLKNAKRKNRAKLRKANKQAKSKLNNAASKGKAKLAQVNRNLNAKLRQAEKQGRAKLRAAQRKVNAKINQAKNKGKAKLNQVKRKFNSKFKQAKSMGKAKANQLKSRLSKFRR